ncbi:vitamin B12 independent methionine synthase [Ligilactobacillus sp. WILCCON 0076]|uniref:Vitamin B12 independent methionine synthase n=1 Tax=Ligilactobacillus ubinensis TaxID=2876789 RepID=A0A9X2FR09_9LACO|nr:vitamin B12 independent methionine synthase [Ligilactobacillus ubinensis]MCP0887991.1 vitamin B12 independent methionine synthase [Ligilactobacillus ubinensis]
MTEQNQIKVGPFRYDIVGSFLRTPELKDALAKKRTHTVSDDEFSKIQKTEIKKLIDQEVAHGLRDVTDGEFSRSWWHLDFLWGLKGVKRYDYQHSYKFQGAKTRTDNAELDGHIAYNPEHPFFDAFKTLKESTPAQITPKQTIPSPTMLFRDNRSDKWPEFYEQRIDYLHDLAKAYNQTIQHFYDLGARYVQIDDTTWAFLINKLNATKNDPEEYARYEKLAQEAVIVINEMLTGLPTDLTVTTHICRGNFRSTFLFAGGYQAVAKYLAQLNYDGFFLEYDNERSGDFAPLKTIFNNRLEKRIVLGLITSKDGKLEDRADIINRIHEASKYVPLSNLAISTQCGFASTEEGNTLTEEQQWSKIDLVKSIAQEIWLED